jgi:hypothetical protein
MRLWLQSWQRSTCPRCAAARKDLDNDHAAAAARAWRAMIGRGVRIGGVVHCRRINLQRYASDLTDAEWALILRADYNEVRHIFSRRGAYGRYKDLLVRRGALERWYDFSNKSEETALREWCAENGIELSET